MLAAVDGCARSCAQHGELAHEHVQRWSSTDGGELEVTPKESQPPVVVRGQRVRAQPQGGGVGDGARRGEQADRRSGNVRQGMSRRAGVDAECQPDGAEPGLLEVWAQGRFRDVGLCVESETIPMRGTIEGIEQTDYGVNFGRHQSLVSGYQLGDQCCGLRDCAAAGGADYPDCALLLKLRPCRSTS